MIPVSDVLSDVKRLLGGCSDADAYSRINDAVELLSAEALWDPAVGYVDVCVDSCGSVTLPWSVDTVMAVTVNGRPTQAHDFWFQFHLNGPGSGSRQTAWHWSDSAPVSTYVQPKLSGEFLFATAESPLDTSATLRVFGYGPSGDWIRTLGSSGAWEDGFLVPISHGGSPTRNPNAPRISVIDRIQKSETEGMIKLYASTDADGLSPIIRRIGLYRPKETLPQYRRIRVAPTCSCVRVAFRKTNEKLSEPTDLIHLHSRYAVLLAVKALKKWDEDRIEEGEAYMRKAVILLEKKQESGEVPAGPSVQIADGNLIANKGDRLD